MLKKTLLATGIAVCALSAAAAGVSAQGPCTSPASNDGEALIRNIVCSQSTAPQQGLAHHFVTSQQGSTQPDVAPALRHNSARNTPHSTR